MKCATCNFCSSFSSFGGRGKTVHGFQCAVTRDAIFQISNDEAKTMAMPIYDEYAGRFSHLVDTDINALDRVTPSGFSGWKDNDWRPDKLAFWRKVLLGGCECFVHPEKMRDHVECLEYEVERWSKKVTDANEELARILCDLDSARVAVQVLV